MWFLSGLNHRPLRALIHKLTLAQRFCFKSCRCGTRWGLWPQACLQYRWVNLLSVSLVGRGGGNDPSDPQAISAGLHMLMSHTWRERGRGGALTSKTLPTPEITSRISSQDPGEDLFYKTSFTQIYKSWFTYDSFEILKVLWVCLTGKSKSQS